MTKRIKIFATKEDLNNMFKKYQNALEIYYTPTYSDIGKTEFKDITSIKNFGINTIGSRIGNNQFRIFLKSDKAVWEMYNCKIDSEKTITRYTTLCDNNENAVDIDIGGVYQNTVIFPTEIGTLHFENENVKIIFKDLIKTIRKESVSIINGYYICKQAYENRNLYRFCTIDISSPPDYDLKF